MRHLEVRPIPFPERLRQSNGVLRCILSCWSGSSSLWRSRRRRYLYCKRWFKVFYFSGPLCILLWFLLRDKLSKTETHLSSNEVTSRSRNVRGIIYPIFIEFKFLVFIFKSTSILAIRH
jgi:hypothetical protein